VGSKHPLQTENIVKLFCPILEFGKDFNFCFGDENGKRGNDLFFTYKEKGRK